MSRKQWLLLIIVTAVVAYLVVSKIDPAAGWSIDNVMLGTIGNVKASIEATPVWQQYDVWFSAVFFTTVTALVMWKGRPMYNRFRGIAEVSAVGGQGYQVVPTAQPMTIPTPKPPTVTVTPQPVIQKPPKEKEATT